MGRAPNLILICGLLGVGAGAALLAVSDRVEGLVWLATAITVLGLSLGGLWFWSRFSDKGKEIPQSAADPLPGRWYPYAIIGVGVALSAWFLYWTKFR